MGRRTLITSARPIATRTATNCTYTRAFSASKEWEKAKDSSLPLTERTKAAFQSGKEVVMDAAKTAKEGVKDMTMRNDSTQQNKEKNQVYEDATSANKKAKEGVEKVKYEGYEAGNPSNYRRADEINSDKARGADAMETAKKEGKRLPNRQRILSDRQRILPKSIWTMQRFQLR